MDGRRTIRRRQPGTKPRKRRRPLFDESLESGKEETTSGCDSPLVFRHDSILRVTTPSSLIQNSISDEDLYPASPASAIHDDSQDAEDNDKSSPPFPRPQSRKVICNRRDFEKLREGTLHGVQYALVRVSAAGFPVSGTMWLSVVQGQVDVFGATLSAAEDPVLVASAPLAPFLIRLSASDENSFVGMPRNSTTEKKHPDALLHIKVSKSLSLGRKISESKNCILLLTSAIANSSPLQASDGCSACGDITTTLAPLTQSIGLPSLPPGEALISNVSLSPPTDKFPVFETWRQWDKVKSECDRFIASASAKDFRLLVCGSGGTGKSIFARCLTNHLLGTHPVVVLVDTDVGQPEMNIPGLVAAHAIKSRRIGAAVTLARSVPISARFFGETTPRENPDFYVECVEEVCRQALDYARKNSYPVVVNSDGWITGVGSDLLHHLSREMKASHVAHLKFESVSRKHGVSELCSQYGPDRVFEIDCPHEKRSNVFSSSSSRDLQIAAYFGKELSLSRVYKVYFADVDVIYIGDDAARTCPIECLNASLIALSQRVCGGDRGSQNNVQGFGIVRGVNMREGEVFVSTPLSLDLLQRIDTILVSDGIQIPHSIYVSIARSSKISQQMIPFLMKGTISTGEPMRSRSSLNRR